ncbi:MAG: C39 family peptidase [Anaerolineaceae bacterium]|jgi:hypothetical protein
MTQSKNTQYVKRKLTRKSLWKRPWFYLLLILAVILIAIGLYQIPAIQDKAYFYVASARADIAYFFNPPAKQAFSPSGNNTLEPDVVSSLTAMAPTVTATLEPTQTPTPLPTKQDTPTPTLTLTPTLTPTPIPGTVKLTGIQLELQRFNNCGPTNLAMALSYWGWEGDQFVTEDVLKPRREDRNVMPYEMLDYVQTETNLLGVLRYGGDLDMVKKFVAAGFPVLIERGYKAPKEGWMGHYGIIYAYDDEKGEVRIPDSYLGDISLKYENIQMYWNQFDGIYLVIYPPEREQEVLDILGPQADRDYNLQYALDQVTERIKLEEGRELFFAWYSQGSILVEMNDYYGAAKAFDQAWVVYDELPYDQRPWRITWYQTGPYFAYYYTGRYQDVLDLANQTLYITPEDALPETWVWRGRANVMLGNRETAIADFRRALEWHPGWWVALDELQALGIYE